jgi:hypothetical protein
MITPPAQPDSAALARLDEVIGYLNFSSGARDSRVLSNLNVLFDAAESTSADEQPAKRLCDWLLERMDRLPSQSAAFGDVEQAHMLVRLLRDHLFDAYRRFHRDLLWHQPDRDLWRPFLMGQAWESLLQQGPPWNETDRIVNGALGKLNSYIGYRPVPAIESERQMEPYAHEWLAPIPLYIREVGVACGPYRELLEQALAILSSTRPDILRQAWFEPDQVLEIALDPRAYEFDHPASKRPNHHFGQWDPNSVDNRGYYRRFVLQQVTLDALLARVHAERIKDRKNQEPDACSSIHLFESAAVLAGTILMASGISGNGPGCHGSDVTLSTLLPHIAAYRDRFYEELLARTPGVHGERLRAEAVRTKQPFGGARQYLNQDLARRRAAQMQHVQLAQIYARMGYPKAALAEAEAVRTASARMISQIYCRLAAGHQAIDVRQLDAAALQVPEIEDLLQRGIECGAVVDPWNVIGFGGNFSLFPALENSVHDFRVDELIELMQQILDLCARGRTEAAALDDSRHETVFEAALERLARWWDRFATASVSGVKRLVGKEIEVSANLVAGALSAWQKAGAEAGNVRFWRMFVDQFDSPKAFQLVIDALVDRGDRVASMALMLQWISQVERTPLVDGDVSFHQLALRWLHSVEQYEISTGVDQWPMVEKFFSHLEASADLYWQVPSFSLAEDENGRNASRGEGFDDEAEFGLAADGDLDEEESSLYSAAYEDMIYRDSTDDGQDASILDKPLSGAELELEQEAERVGRQLEFLKTVAQLWRHAAIAWNSQASDKGARQESLAGWFDQAVERYSQLLELLEAVYQFRLSQPTGSHESMVEFDRQRLVKESLLEHIVSTGVEMAGAGRLLGASAPVEYSDGDESPFEAAPIRMLQLVLAGDPASARKHWPAFAEWLGDQELLYVPLGRQGRPRRIVRARAIGQLLLDLLDWLPRIGMIRETCQLLDLAQGLEMEHPVGAGAVTEFDRLFARGYEGMMRCLIASANRWENTRALNETRNRVRPAANKRFKAPPPESDTMLVEALQSLTEAQLHRWLSHSRTLRLSVVERLGPDAEWNGFVAFVERYGHDLFTQKFLYLGNLRAILHQRVAVWLSNLESEPPAEEPLLFRELGGKISREDAAKWLSIAIEAIVENYREYRDYNTTTTHSDHGELLYSLIDFLRLRAAYDRVAWNLRPVVIAHEILVREGRHGAAELWQQALAERTAETADAHLASYETLCEQYGIRLPTVAERLAERFTRPLTMDRMRALVEPAVSAAGTDDKATFDVLRQEIDSMAQQPAGAGLDLPDWIEALEEEVRRCRCKRRRGHPEEGPPPRIAQATLSWEDWHRQIVQEG